MLYRYHGSIVLDTLAKATSWRNGIKTKAIALKTAGTIPAWLTGTAKIGIYPYFIGGSGTFTKGMAYPTPPPPETPPEELPLGAAGGIMYRVDVQASFDTLEKATQCGEVIEAEAMAARSNDLLPAWVGAEWGVQEINEVAVPAAVEEVLPG
ncbi:MAG TPA: hypothetical protein DDY86_04710 [Syntrophaceae bacterium]|nr:hypothetical protein [Syntrophaceae bacterium]